MQIPESVLRLWSSWRRSITGWFSQQYQLYLWSVYVGVRETYCKPVKYPAVLILAGVSGLLMVMICGIVDGLAICVGSVSILGMHITVINASWYFSLRDVYKALYDMSTFLLYGKKQDIYRELRGYALDVFLGVTCLQIVLWLAWYHAGRFIWMHDTLECTWVHMVYLQPIVLFTSFFLVDGGYTWRSLLYSVRRAFRLLWFNLPVCLIIVILASIWKYLMALVIYGSIIEIALMPIWISIWYTVYTKSIYEQFARYYEDILTCRADTA